MSKFGLKQYMSIAVASLSLASSASAATAYINQVGYRTTDPKEFTLFEGSGDIEIVDAAGKTVLTVTPKAASQWSPSGQSVQLVDFSELKILQLNLSILKQYLINGLLHILLE